MFASWFSSIFSFLLSIIGFGHGNGYGDMVAKCNGYLKENTEESKVCFKTFFKKNKNFIISEKLIDEKEQKTTGLELAIKNKQYDVAIWLLDQLENIDFNQISQEAKEAFLKLAIEKDDQFNNKLIQHILNDKSGMLFKKYISVKKDTLSPYEYANRSNKKIACAAMSGIFGDKNKIIAHLNSAAKNNQYDTTLWLFSLLAKADYKLIPLETKEIVFELAVKNDDTFDNKFIRHILEEHHSEIITKEYIDVAEGKISPLSYAGYYDKKNASKAMYSVSQKAMEKLF